MVNFQLLLLLEAFNSQQSLKIEFFCGVNMIAAIEFHDFGRRLACYVSTPLPKIFQIQDELR
jgi:hypothetical protein